MLIYILTITDDYLDLNFFAKNTTQITNWLALFPILFLFGCAVQPPNTVQTSEQKQPIIRDEITNKASEQAIVPILIYHQIRQITASDGEQNQTFIVNPENFEKQLAYLKENNFNAISFEDLSNYFDGKSTLPIKPIIISFDDGTINQYENAFPLLKKYGFRATFFIFANPIGKNKNYLNWEHLQEMAGAGMEIGGHGWYHLYLTKISSTELDREITASKLTIEEKIKKPLLVFAYPFGDYNEDIIFLLKKAGYTMARDIINGKEQLKNKPYRLKGYFITENFVRFSTIVNN